MPETQANLIENIRKVGGERRNEPTTTLTKDNHTNMVRVCGDIIMVVNPIAYMLDVLYSMCLTKAHC